MLLALVPCGDRKTSRQSQSDRNLQQAHFGYSGAGCVGTHALLDTSKAG